MKKSKRYLACFLALLMAVGSINIGLATDVIISTEDLNSESEETITQLDQLETNTVSGNSIEEDVILEDEVKSNNEVLSNDSNIQLTSETDDLELNETDNWELGLVFYDSSVNNGRTPLTEINWDASNGDYNEGNPRVITVQINYRNTNCITTYNPGDLNIDIDNLVYQYKSYDNIEEDVAYWANWTYNSYSNIVIGANDSTHTGYDWKVTKYSNSKYFTFSNTITFEEGSSFEGSIQITYTITPGSEEAMGETLGCVEKYEDECIHNYNKTLSAELRNITFSNDIVFNYTRTYTHIWQKNTYTLNKSVSKISSYDGLGTNPDDYIWVKYTLFSNREIKDWQYITNHIPYIMATNFIKKELPDGCVAYYNEEQISEINIPLVFGNYSSEDSNKETIFIGYPKSIYNESNYLISDDFELWGTYQNETEEELLDNKLTNLNLNDFKFSYSSSGTSRFEFFHGNNYVYYQHIIRDLNSYNTFGYYLRPNTTYNGELLTVKVGFDLLYITDTDGEYVKMEDDEYYLNSFSFYPSKLKNGNGNIIKSGKYDCELWVRYAHTNEYVLYDSFKNPDTTKHWTFAEEEQISACYIIINDMSESIKGMIMYSDCPFYVSSKILKKDISETGYVYGFGYLEVYSKDDNNNLILKNPATLNNYNNIMTQKNIAQYDLDTYGHYLQRGCDNEDWQYYNLSQANARLYPILTSSAFVQDIINENFTTRINIGCDISSNIYKWEKDFIDDYDDEYAAKGFKIYYLLPKGMELISTEDEILDSITFSLSNQTEENRSIYKLDKITKLTSSDLLEITNSVINITNNWNNTGRTRIEIITNFKEPFFGMANGHVQVKYCVNCKVSYDSYMEYGSIWNYHCYVKKLDEQIGGIYDTSSSLNYTKIQDNGIYDKEEIDIDGNNDNEEYLGLTMKNNTIVSSISTHQDIQTQVKTDKNNYSVGTVDSSLDSIYSYKLKAKTGNNNITNLIIYDSLENAHNEKEHWNGEFLGIDTSYAENKGYTVKSYYSENIEAGNLYNEDGILNSDWKEYSDLIDKTKVKSLAFEFLDSDGNPAIIPANSIVYVLVNMKSPVDGSINSLAYNKCRTQWNAIDEFNQPVDFITGLTSNTVKVALPNSQIFGSYNVKHEYYKKEMINTNALTITFNNQCAGESKTYDYVEIYYKQDGNTYKLDKYRADDLAGKSITVPSDDFYLYWRTDSSSNNYYGFSIDKIEAIQSEETIIGTNTTLPNFEIIELSGTDYPETEHNPYSNNSNLLWHYTGEIGRIPKYTLENSVIDEEISVPIETVLNSSNIEQKLINNGNKYVYWNDNTEDIILSKDETSEVVVKYFRQDVQYGSYVIKHQYYVKDKDGNITLEDTVTSEEIQNIVAGSEINSSELEHNFINNGKTYVLQEDSTVTIEPNLNSDLIIKYIRDELYGNYKVEHQYYVRDRNGKITYEGNICDEEVFFIVEGTIINTVDLEHRFIYNNKTYDLLEDDSGSIIYGETYDLTIKYIRDEEYGSYEIEHQYYVKDKDGNITLEGTVSGSVIPDIIAGSIINSKDSDNILVNNGKVYIVSESGTVLISPNLTNKMIIKYIRDEQYGSYVIKHQYYVKDKEGNITLEDTVTSEEIPNIIAGSSIDSSELEHTYTNNGKTYILQEDSNITIEPDKQSDVVIKYIRDEEYGSYEVKHIYYVKDPEGNLVEKETVAKEVKDIVSGTTIKIEDILVTENKDKEYTYSGDVEDFVIETDIKKEISISYVRDMEVPSYTVNQTAEAHNNYYVTLSGTATNTTTKFENAGLHNGEVVVSIDKGLKIVSANAVFTDKDGNKFTLTEDMITVDETTNTITFVFGKDANGNSLNGESLTYEIETIVLEDDANGIKSTAENEVEVSGYLVTENETTSYWMDKIAYDNSPVTIKNVAKVKESTLTINPNGGSYENSTNVKKITNIKYNTDVELSIPERKGYTFTGWTIPDNSATLKDNTITMGYEDVEVTANWEINQYKLTIDLNGGNVDDSEDDIIYTLDYGTEQELPTPVRPGYIFDGWDNSNSDSEIQDNKVTIGEGDTTLTAKWQPDSFDVTYIDIDSNGNELGRQVIKKPYNSVVKGSDLGSDKTDNAYYNGYVLDSWTESTVTLDGATVYRTFVTKTHNIIFNLEWNDNNNVDNLRPYEVGIHLLQNGEIFESEYIRSNIENYTHIFENLPQYDSDGNPYSYTFNINSNDRYEISYDLDRNVYILNYKQANFNVIIPKYIVLDGNTGIANYEVTVNGTFYYNDTLTVTPANSLILNDKLNISSMTADISQEKVSFVKEDIIQNNKTLGSIQTENSTFPGKWTGTFNFNINFQKKNIER